MGVRLYLAHTPALTVQFLKRHVKGTNIFFIVLNIVSSISRLYQNIVDFVKVLLIAQGADAAKQKLFGRLWKKSSIDSVARPEVHSLATDSWDQPNHYPLSSEQRLLFAGRLFREYVFSRFWNVLVNPQLS